MYAILNCNTNALWWDRREIMPIVAENINASFLSKKAIPVTGHEGP
jgi:hypothetical protein